MIYYTFMKGGEILRYAGKRAFYFTGVDRVLKETKWEEKFLKEQGVTRKFLLPSDVGFRNSLTIRKERAKIVLTNPFVILFRITGMDGMIRLVKKVRKSQTTTQTSIED